MSLREELKQEFKNDGGDAVPAPWRPQQEGAGAIVAGRLVKVERDVPTEYGAFDVAHVEDSERGCVAVWLSHHVLRDRWQKAGPKPGDEVGVLYLGEREGSSRSYHHYRVRVRRADERQQEQPPPIYDDGYGAEQDRDALPY